MWKILIVFFLLFVLSGCAGESFFNDYETYTKAHSDHSNAEAQRITSQSNAIRDTIKSAWSTDETRNILLAVIGTMSIERLKHVPLNINKPTTGFDVLNTFTSHIPFMATTLGMYKLGEAGIEAAGNVNFQGDATLTNSLNRPEVHTTGSGNTTNYTGTTPQQVVDPVIVEPTIIFAN